MLGRLVQATDFQRLLATPARWRAVHFVVHHLGDRPQSRSHDPRASLGDNMNLSTGHAPCHPQTVDDTAGVLPVVAGREDAFAVAPSDLKPTDRWLGCVVPKRQARRAVTRSMIKRQMRAAMQRHEDHLAPGLWLVRLRQGFPVAEYRSADSARLRLAVRSELEQLLGRAARRPAQPVSGKSGEFGSSPEAHPHPRQAARSTAGRSGPRVQEGAA